ncbi:MAG: sulfatase-like hydrolase/transferase [Halioglobus sp.]|nr:sulfatase-like hydrolase/transferase [Halioglobus sp.]
MAISKYLLPLALVVWLTAPPAQAGRNILFIIIDDMRLDTQALTPNIDAFAATSTNYTNAYATVPACIGSRASLLTGMKPSTHGLTSGFVSPQTYNDFYNAPSLTTLPEELSAAGYYAATMGKVNHIAFPAHWDLLQPFTTIEIYRDHFPLNPGPDGTYFNPILLPAGDTHPDQEVASWATNFLNTYSGPAPFFLAIGFEQPHVPWVLPQSYYDLYPSPAAHVPPVDDFDDEPGVAETMAMAPLIDGVPQHTMVVNAGKAEDYTGAYLAAMSHTDDMVGQVINALQASGYASSTDIVLLSDHGYHLGEKSHWRKLTFWEPAVRVPLMINSPALSPGDITAPVSLLDVAPTILDLAGATAPAQFEGVSLTTGASAVEIYLDDGMATVSGHTKTIDYFLGLPGSNHNASYDLLTDPGELVNLTPPGC